MTLLDLLYLYGIVVLGCLGFMGALVHRADKRHRQHGDNEWWR